MQIRGGATADTLNGLASDDDIYGFGGNDTIHGNDGDDRIFGGAGTDLVFGDAGDDTLFYEAGNDTIVGGAGYDIFDLRSARVVPVGNDLTAVQESGPTTGISLDLTTGFAFALPSITNAPITVEDDFIHGSGEDAGFLGQLTFSTMEEFDLTNFSDFIIGNSADLTIDARGGNDAIVAGSGRENIFGGSGFDWVSYSNSTASVSVALQDGSASGGFATGDSLDSIEAVAGSNFNDTLQGRFTGADTLAGLEGDDSLIGFGGNDTLLGGGGDDSLVGGLGNDTIDGGDGVDTVSYALNGHSVVVTLADVTLLNTLGTGTGLELTTDDDPVFDPPTGEIAGTDSLRGVENVIGTNDDDILSGNSADNELTGRGGDDLLRGGGGDDTLDGGGGVDTADYSTMAAGGRVTVDLATGTADEVRLIFGLPPVFQHTADTLISIENATGSGGGDTLIGNSGANTLLGGGGNDVVRGGGGNDILDGEDGIDTADYSDRSASVLATLAGPTVSQVFVGGVADSLIRNFENLTGGSAADVLIGDGLANTLDGGGSGDTMIGNGGDDIFVVDDAGDQAIELDGQGDDTVQASIGFVLSDNIERLTLLGADNINGTGNDLDNLLTGNAGNNVLNGLTGADTMRGLGGNDTYIVDNAGDVVDETGGSGFDRVHSAASINLSDATHFLGDIEMGVLLGSANLNLIGNGLNNLLIGNAGANLVNGGTGADIMRGMAGNDTYFVDNAGDIVDESVAGSGGFDRVHSSVSFSLSDTAHFLGGIEMGVLLGGANLYLAGNGLNNLLIGNAGANLVNGAGGADIMRGMAGNDTYIIDNAGDVVDESIAGSGGFDRVHSTISLNLSDATHFLGGIEMGVLLGSANLNLVGNGLNNLLIGNAGANVINGLGGADIMRGMAGNDTYIVDNAGDVVDESVAGSGGFDRVHSTVSLNLSDATHFLGQVEMGVLLGSANLDLAGNGLNNLLIGNAGANVINGGVGNDTLTGGAGADTFAFTTALNGATNVDAISDFNVAADTIRLENAIFTGLAAGVLAVSAFHIGAAAADTSDRIVYNSATGALSFDADGLGGVAAIQFAHVTAGLALTNADFVVV